MGRFAQKHPEELARAIGEACANGLTASACRRQLASGTFPNWQGPYDIPLETVRYYARQERKRRAKSQVSQAAKDNPKREVDRLARLLLTRAQRALEDDLTKDPKAIKEWGEALKVVNSLVTDTAQEDRPAKQKRKQQPVPTDPLSARLLATNKTPNGKTGEAQGSAQPPTQTPTEPPTSIGGVPAEAAEQAARGGAYTSWA